MKFLKKHYERTLLDGVYTTVLRKVRYLYFRRTGEICGIYFTVDHPIYTNRSYGFAIFSQHLNRVLTKLCRDLRMKPLESYGDGQEEEFLNDLSSHLPISITLRVFQVTRAGNTEKRYYLTYLQKFSKLPSDLE